MKLGCKLGIVGALLFPGQSINVAAEMAILRNGFAIRS